MNTSKSSYKRLMSLVLSMLMIVAMLSVSAAALNQYIYVNGELAVDGTEYNEDVKVEIKGIDDMTGVVVTVNKAAVVLNNGEFDITVENGVEVGTETPDTADTAEPSKAPVASGAAANDGKYTIVVTQNGNDVSSVTIVVKAKDAVETPEPGVETPEPGVETPEPGIETPDPLKPFYGDVNLDGKVTAKDSLLAQRYAIKLEKLNDQQLLNGDVNGDGKVTAADAFLILRHAIKAISKFPVEEK